MFEVLLSEKMDPFYQNISSFPTIVYTFCLALCVLYWLVAVLGLIDIGVLDFVIPSVDEGFELDATQPYSNAEALAGLMLKHGLYGVPVTVIISFLSLFGWLLSFYMVHFSFGIIPEGFLQIIAGIVVLIISFYVSVLMTSVLTGMLRPLFRKAQQETTKLVLGQTAIVRTSRVDRVFGEALLEDGGAGLILKVRSSGDETFIKGDKVILLEYLENENTYRVISEKEFTS